MEKSEISENNSNLRGKNIQRKKLEKRFQKFFNYSNILDRSQVGFGGNKSIPFNRLYTFKEGFSSELIKKFINEYPKNNGVILDPFAGSCTTLFTAQQMGYESFGIELLPIGKFLFDSRKVMEKIDSSKLVVILEKIRNREYLKTSQGDKYFKHITITTNAFPDDTEEKMRLFLNFIESINDPDIKQILKFSCFCILEKISFTRKDGQFLRWDHRSKKSKTTFQKEVHSFDEALLQQLNRIIEDIQTSTFSYLHNYHKPVMTLELGSCLEILPNLADNSFDLVITSPPYCNRYDYTRTYALELAYLGVNDSEIKKLRQKMLSCTVENKEKDESLEKYYSQLNKSNFFTECENAFYSNEVLNEIFEIMKHHMNNKILNNPFVYRMIRNYFYEHSFVIFELSRVLKKGGRVYYVNDNVRYAGEIIPVDLILSDFAEKAGLVTRRIDIVKSLKGNSSQQMGNYGKENLRKCICCWEKIG